MIRARAALRRVARARVRVQSRVRAPLDTQTRASRRRRRSNYFPAVRARQTFDRID